MHDLKELCALQYKEDECGWSGGAVVEAVCMHACSFSSHFVL